MAGWRCMFINWWIVCAFALYLVVPPLSSSSLFHFYSSLFHFWLSDDHRRAHISLSKWLIRHKNNVHTDCHWWLFVLIKIKNIYLFVRFCCAVSVHTDHFHYYLYLFRIQIVWCRNVRRTNKTTRTTTYDYFFLQIHCTSFVRFSFNSFFSFFSFPFFALTISHSLLWLLSLFKSVLFNCVECKMFINIYHMYMFWIGALLPGRLVLVNFFPVFWFSSPFLFLLLPISLTRCLPSALANWTVSLSEFTSN